MEGEPSLASLDAVLQELADLASADRAVHWRMADLLDSVLPPPRRGRPNPLVGKAAEALGCTRRWVQVLRRVAACFPPDARHADVPFATYVVAASTPDALQALELALARGWSAAELRRALRVPAGERTDAQEVCETCGQPVRHPAR